MQRTAEEQTADHQRCLALHGLAASRYQRAGEPLLLLWQAVCTDDRRADLTDARAPHAHVASQAAHRLDLGAGVVVCRRAHDGGEVEVEVGGEGEGEDGALGSKLRIGRRF